VGAGLTSAGFDVDVLRANPGLEVRKYDAVVIGSPIYGSKWLPAASVFLVANAEELSKLPVAIFSSGMLGLKNPKWAVKEHEMLVSELHQLAPSVSPVSAALFNGSFSRSRLPLCLRIMDMLAGTPQGDRRDWDAINDWAQRMGTRLSERIEAGPQPPALEAETESDGA
jgi:menaquinone-dependent protoporphyrinogen oxidase